MKAFFGCLIVGLAAASLAQRITVSNGHFVLNGKRVWLSGANTPWNKWNDFGHRFDARWWDSHFRELQANGILATRVWVSCDGDNASPGINSQGYVSAPTAQFWADVDKLFSIARQRKVYLMIALISFDHSKPGNKNASWWKAMYGSAATRKSFIDNYAIPFVDRYKDNPYFFAIEAGNELCWTWENHGVARNNTLDLVARLANAVHGRSQVLVTQGDGAGPKYNSPLYEGNFYSNAYLGGLQSGAYLDFYKIHYYDWVRQWFSSPWEKSPSDYQIADKPCIVGECPAKGSAGMTILANYQQAFARGWDGVMPWTSNGVDGNGSIRDIVPALHWASRIRWDAERR